MIVRNGNLLALFRLWRSNAQARAVMAEYQSNLPHRLMLADIAARGGVFEHKSATATESRDYLEGRRSLALELLALMGAKDLFLLADILASEIRKANQRGPK